MQMALPLLLSGVHRKQALPRARAWFARLGLDGLEQRRSGELSGGQAQRVALARGLVAEPQVLFAEATEGLVEAELRFWSGARQLETKEARHAVIRRVLPELQAAGVTMSSQVQQVEVTPPLKEDETPRRARQ